MGKKKGSRKESSYSDITKQVNKKRRLLGIIRKLTKKKNKLDKRKISNNIEGELNRLAKIVERM